MATDRREFEAGPWKVSVIKKHILRSKCQREKAEGCDAGSRDICTVCRLVSMGKLKFNIFFFFFFFFFYI